MSQKKVTTSKSVEMCPAELFIKAVSGKWKARIFHLAQFKPLRFNTLMRELEGVNKQSLSKALKELNEDGYLDKNVVQEKPLHIEYTLSQKGEELIPIFKQLENL